MKLSRNQPAGISDRLEKVFCTVNMIKKLGGLIFCMKEDLLKKIGNFNEGAICFEDLEEFSDQLKETVRLFIGR